MSGPKRNPDKLNTLGVIVIGICASVLVYVTIVALQAFYMKDTSEIQTMADYGGNDTTFRTVKAAAMNNITEYGKNPDGTFRIAIDLAMKKVAVDAKTKPEELVPGTPSTSPSAEPVFGRSKPLAAPAASGDAGSAAAPDAGSAAGVDLQTPTGGQGGPAPTTGAANPGTSSPAAESTNAGSGSAAKGNAP